MPFQFIFAITILITFSSGCAKKDGKKKGLDQPEITTKGPDKPNPKTREETPPCADAIIKDVNDLVDANNNVATYMKKNPNWSTNTSAHKNVCALGSELQKSCQTFYSRYMTTYSCMAQDVSTGKEIMLKADHYSSTCKKSDLLDKECKKWSEENPAPKTPTACSTSFEQDYTNAFQEAKKLVKLFPSDGKDPTTEEMKAICDQSKVFAGACDKLQANPNPQDICLRSNDQKEISAKDFEKSCTENSKLNKKCGEGLFENAQVEIGIVKESKSIHIRFEEKRHVVGRTSDEL